MKKCPWNIDFFEKSQKIWHHKKFTSLPWLRDQEITFIKRVIGQRLWENFGFVTLWWFMTISIYKEFIRIWL